MQLHAACNPCCRRLLCGAAPNGTSRWPHPISSPSQENAPGTRTCTDPVMVCRQCSASTSLMMTTRLMRTCAAQLVAGNCELPWHVLCRSLEHRACHSPDGVGFQCTSTYLYGRRGP